MASDLGEQVECCGTDRLRTRLRAAADARAREERSDVGLSEQRDLSAGIPTWGYRLSAPPLRFDSSQYTSRSDTATSSAAASSMGMNFFQWVLLWSSAAATRFADPVAVLRAPHQPYFQTASGDKRRRGRRDRLLRRTTMLVHRRLLIRAFAKLRVPVISVLLMLYLQLTLGLCTIAVSAQHLDGTEMVKSWNGRKVS